jgi:hypothetical protein
VSADDLSIIQGPRGIESFKDRSGPARSIRNRHQRVRSQVPQARSDPDAAKAIISMEIVSSGSRTATTTTTVRLSRKAAKRSELCYLASPPPQDEDIPATKKPRFEIPIATVTAEAATETASPVVARALPPPPADDDAGNDDDDNDADANTDADDADGVNTDSVTETQPKAGASTVTRRRWTLEEDAKLASTVNNTSKRKCGKEYKINWDAVATLVPSRTSRQCYNKWNGALDPNIDRANGRTGTWAEGEDSKLKDAVQIHGSKNWGAVAALVPGRTKNSCRARWRDALDPNIDRANVRTTKKWLEDEDSKLKDAVQIHGSKNWDAVAALIPGRTQKQCNYRWQNTLDPSIALTTGRTGTWAEDEDSKLKNAVRMHGCKD